MTTLPRTTICIVCRLLTSTLKVHLRQKWPYNLLPIVLYTAHLTSLTCTSRSHEVKLQAPCTALTSRHDMPVRTRGWHLWCHYLHRWNLCSTAHFAPTCPTALRNPPKLTVVVVEACGINKQMLQV